MKDGKENNVVAQVLTQTRMPIIYPKVPKEVKEPVAPLFQEWATIVDGYESNPTGLRAAWLYLGHHPAFWNLQDAPGGGLRLSTGTAWYRSIETGFEEDDYVWMEIRPSYWPNDPTEEQIRVVKPSSPPHYIEVIEHNYDEALVTAASTVHERYGNDREFLGFPLQGRWFG